MPLCADQPGWRNFVCVPSTQHSSKPEARLPAIPAACAVDSASMLSSLAARNAAPKVENKPVGWNPRLCSSPEETLPTRQETSLPRAMAVIKSRPVTAVNSERASAAATAGLLMCTIDSLCVSSYSRACERAPLANAAEVTPTRSPKPRMRHGPAGDIATMASRVAFPKAVSAPASDSPMTSMTRSLVASTTSAGRSSNRRRDAHAARALDSGGFTALLYNDLRPPKQC